jgi:P27 family predicted phage terminase small subunit
MPPRRSTASKFVNGSVRADRLPRQDKATRLVEAPSPPVHLSSRARAEWDRLAPVAHALGTLTEADLRAFELLTETLASEAEARETVACGGLAVPTRDGGLKPHPGVKIMECARAQAHRLLSDFGLTPRGRQGVDTTPPRKPTAADAYFDTFHTAG